MLHCVEQSPLDNMKIFIVLVFVALANVRYAESKFNPISFMMQCSREVNTVKALVESGDIFKIRQTDIEAAVKLGKCFVSKSGVMEEVRSSHLQVAVNLIQKLEDGAAVQLLRLLKECAVQKGSPTNTILQFIDCAANPKKLSQILGLKP